jgi:hypothetical protein
LPEESVDMVYSELTKLEQLSSLLKAVCNSCQMMSGYEVENALASLQKNIHESVERMNEIFDEEIFQSKYGEEEYVDPTDTTEDLDSVMQSWVKNDK